MYAKSYYTEHIEPVITAPNIWSIHVIYLLDNKRSYGPKGIYYGDFWSKLKFITALTLCSVQNLSHTEINDSTFMPFIVIEHFLAQGPQPHDSSSSPVKGYHSNQLRSIDAGVTRWTNQFHAICFIAGPI